MTNEKLTVFFTAYSNVTTTGMGVRSRGQSALLAWLVLVLVCASVPTALGKCRAKKYKRCGWDYEDYLTRSGYSPTMNIKKCAEWCMDETNCFSFRLWSVTWGPPGKGQRLYGCSLYKDKNPRKVRGDGPCGLIKCS
jgi:hypothetical protein